VLTLFLGTCQYHSHKVPGSRNGVEGRDFVKLWYEGVYPFGTRTRILVRESVANGSMTLGRS